ASMIKPGEGKFVIPNPRPSNQNPAALATRSAEFCFHHATRTVPQDAFLRDYRSAGRCHARFAQPSGPWLLRRQLVHELRPHVLDQLAHIVADSFDAVEFQKLLVQLLKLLLLHDTALEDARLIDASCLLPRALLSSRRSGHPLTFP